MVQTTFSNISKLLTEDVIDKAFKIRTNSQDSVKSIMVTRAAPAGEGLLSAVYRINVDGLQNSASFVVKGLVTDPLLQKTLRCSEYFKREADFFNEILPVLCGIQMFLGGKERLQNNIPISYKCHHDGLNDYILLEDLAETNCRSLCKIPTKEERVGVLETLAHLHAVSMALRLKNLEQFMKIASSLSELYFNEKNREWYTPYLKAAVAIDHKVIAEFEKEDSIYMKKFNEVIDNDIYEQYISLASTWGDHPVLCHGDAWVPNFLCSPERIVAIDFQLLRCASPATDLVYWIMLCTNKTTVKQDFLDDVDIYYTALTHYLKDMGLEAEQVFPRTSLDQEIKLNGKLGYLATLTSFPLMSANKCDVLGSIEDQFPDVERIPLESLWQVVPIEELDLKLRILNGLRVAVDIGLI